MFSNVEKMTKLFTSLDKEKLVVKRLAKHTFERPPYKPIEIKKKNLCICEWTEGPVA